MYIQMSIACGGRISMWTIDACKALGSMFTKRRRLSFDDVAEALVRKHGFDKKNIEASEFVPNSSEYTACLAIPFMISCAGADGQRRWVHFPDEVMC
jgi:hypothetical protein